ncbi:DNA cytosine methyltransferase [Methanoplanus sp. FWC-SCC4]|uniref:DNA (cytosine-5-)-methyltransferase n=1 Tax=Methanochimaera problematica TaxID=2609417 RepID=A0AA97FC84_9EURY|nr:DNA cytosine methyltransferase [Methanoplanus sp. FWC-SCC4]WOF16810.1 DNA cytosine methyltransferase [Methanoplanus sp. FWC-SCC4]
MIEKEQVCELFCGAGGMGLGFSRFFDISYAVDFKKQAVETYQSNHFETQVRQQDVRDITGCYHDFDGLTGVIGGPPCQGSSIMNTKRCADDPRNALMFEYMRLVDEIRPRFYVMENVPGVSKKIKEDVIKLGKMAGYDVKSIYLNAAEYGAAQTRKRWIVVGTRGKSWHMPGTQPAKTVREAFSDINENWGLMQSSEKTLNNLKNSTSMEWTPMTKGGKFKHLIRLDFEKPSPAVVNVKKVYMVHPTEDRNISLAEAAALQGFPPGYQWKGTESEIAQMIANAMPAELAASIAGSFSTHQATVQTELIRGIT